MKSTNSDRIAKWEAELAKIEDQILRNIRWVEARRFAANVGWNRHMRRHWLIEHIADAKSHEFRREAPSSTTPTPTVDPKA